MVTFRANPAHLQAVGQSRTKAAGQLGQKTTQKILDILARHPHLNRWELVVPSQYLNPGFRRLKIGYKPGFKGESLLPLRARRGFLFDWCGFLEIKRQNQSVTDISGSLRSLFVRH